MADPTIIKYEVILEVEGGAVNREAVRRAIWQAVEYRMGTLGLSEDDDPGTVVRHEVILTGSKVRNLGPCPIDFPHSKGGTVRQTRVIHQRADGTHYVAFRQNKKKVERRVYRGQDGIFRFPS